MQEAFKGIAEALKQAGYTKVEAVAASRPDHANIIVGPVSLVVTKERPKEDKRATPVQIPELIMDPKTRNFAALSVFKDAGLSFDDVQVFNNDLIIRNVPVPAAKPAPRKETAPKEA